MTLPQLFSQRLEQAIRSERLKGVQRGMQLGIQLGRQKGYLEMLESLLVFRFGELDSQLKVVLEEIMDLPEEDFNRLILELSNLSREELLARFAREN
ncbi:MAG: hypothetical protein AB4080_10630 [Trichodesmium sp.]